jgi:hypothetical protein
MTKDVIELAREAGLLPDNSHPAPETHYMARKEKAVQHFAALVAARERERCAQLCDQWDLTPGSRLASAIRALNTEGEGNDPITG